MPKKVSKTILLTGAPESSSLQWTDEALTASVLPAFATDSEDKSSDPRQVETGPVWRRLPLEKEVLHTGFTPVDHEWRDQAAGVEQFGYPFLDGANSGVLDLSLATSGGQESFIEDNEVANYYSHSLLIHDELPSSQVVADADLSDPDSSLPISDANCTSFSLESFVETGGTSETEHHPKPAIVPIRDLKNLPTINYLLSVIPRRMTVNLIVAIIAIPSPLQLVTRYGRRRIDLVELTVSDDTRSGFAINLWLPPSDGNPPDATASPLLKKAVSKLRPRDVVLLRNVEVNVHEKRVFGQNLRKDLTKTHLLYRDLLNRDDERGAYARVDLNGDEDGDTQLAKVRRVRDWVMDYGPVGLDRRYGDGWEEGSGLEALPPDSS